MSMETKKRRVLIVEDNIDMAENISDALEARGHITDFAIDGTKGLHLAITETYDVIILDLMLPGMDGLTLCKKFREESDRYTPILMLTARHTLEDKLLGFEHGADDYLVKPFSIQELAARVNALAKRHDIGSKKRIRVSDLVMDLGSQKIKRAGKSIALNRTCMTILKILMKASPEVVSKADLEFAIWGDEMPPKSDPLRSHMYTLRRKLDRPFDTALIHTVQGLGYAIRGDDEVS